MSSCVLREAEDAGEIHVDEGFPVFFWVVCGGRAADDAGVVDEDVDGAEVADGLFNEACADGGIGDVAGKGDGFRAERFELMLRGLGRGGGSVDGDVGSGLCKCDGNGGAEAARGAGDECGFAVEIEFSKD